MTVVIDGTGLDRRKAFFKLCEKLAKESGGALEWHEKADPKMKGYLQQLHRKVREMISQYDKRIDEQGASFLAETIGDGAPLEHAHHCRDSLFFLIGAPLERI